LIAGEFVRAGRAVTLNLYTGLYGPLAAGTRRRATGAELRRLAAGLRRIPDHRT
jgi:hypothetical protein